MRTVTFLFFACLVVIVSADETSWYDGLFKWFQGLGYPFSVGLADSRLGSKSKLNVTTIQRFVDANIQHYKDTLMREGRNLSEHFPDSVHLDHWVQPLGFRWLKAHKQSTWSLSNVTVEGLSNPLITTITKMQHRVKQIIDYYLKVDYPTLIMRASYSYRNVSNIANQSNDVHHEGTVLIHFYRSKIEGHIRVEKNLNSNPLEIAKVKIKPLILQAFPIRITGLNCTTIDAALQTWDTAVESIAESFEADFLSEVETKLLRNLNSLIKSPGFPLNA